MARLAIPWAVLAAVMGCSNAAAPVPEQPASRASKAAADGEPTASEPATASQPAPTRPEPTQAIAVTSKTATATACERAESRYLELRTEHNHCERDVDCAEINPGTCPHGPYYVHVQADHAAIDAAAAEMARACEQPACGMPMPLGIAHCEAGRCERGRTPPVETDDESCWDTRVTFMEPERPYLGRAHPHLNGPTPLHAIGVAAPGTLRIDAKLGCSGCELWISEHNSGMGSRVKGKVVPPEPRGPLEVRPMTSMSPPSIFEAVHLELPVTPGPYYLVVLGAEGEVELEVSLRDAEGKAQAPDRLGIVYLRTCEG